MFAHVLIGLFFVGQASAMEPSSANVQATDSRPALIQALEEISKAGMVHIGNLANEVRRIDLCQTPAAIAGTQQNLDQRLRDLSVTVRRMKAELLLRAVESNPIDIVTAARFIVQVDDTRLAIRKKISDFDSSLHISENAGKIGAGVSAKISSTKELIGQCLEENDSALCQSLRASRSDLTKAVGILLTEGDREYRIVESAVRYQINAVRAHAAEVCRARAEARNQESAN